VNYLSRGVSDDDALLIITGCSPRELEYAWQSALSGDLKLYHKQKYVQLLQKGGEK